MKNKPFILSNISIQPGEKLTLALPTPELYTCAPTHIPIHVIHGKKEGPTLVVCAAIHGDEMNGVAIIQKLMNLRLLNSISGTLIAVPSANIYGLITQSRYLPDRRDLQSSFPGSEKGSFAARLAYSFYQEILSKATHCIDLRTGEPHTKKFPQVITSIQKPEAERMAKSFQAPVILDTGANEGLLWLLHREENSIPTIIYKVGESLRLDETGIKYGVQGIVRLMRDLNMIRPPKKPMKIRKPLFIKRHEWVRAPCSGLCENLKKLGSPIKKNDLIAKISDPFGTSLHTEIRSPFNGIIISLNNLPIVNEGDPIIEVAKTTEDYEEDFKTWNEEPLGEPFE